MGFDLAVRKLDVRLLRRKALSFAALAVLVVAHAARVEGTTSAAPLGLLQQATGSVSIQGSAVFSGATVMAGDVIATGANSSARLQLRSGVWATVSPESQILAPPGAQGRDVELRNGTVVVGRQSPDPVRISFPGAWVVVKGSAVAGPLCAVESSGSSSKVTLVAGVAEIHGAGDPVLLHAGQWARLDMGIAPMPQAAGSGGSGAPEAGKVTREVPQGTVQRQGKELPLSMNDAVDWNDTVHTQNKGRLQITLTDGSVLSVGSRSEMKIVKHDAEAQQTDIELVVGTVKADVQKVTKSGGHFEIRTKTAVIGVVGTTLMVTSNSKGTMVCNTTQNSNGEAEVTVSDTNGTQTQKLKSGFCAFFPISGAATALTASASASQIAGMTTATIVATTVAAGAAGSVTLSTGVIVGFIAVGAAVGTTLGVYGAAGGFSNSSPVSVP